MEQAKISLVDLPYDVEDHGPRNQPTPEKSSTDITEYAQAREDGFVERIKRGGLFIHILPRR